MLLGNDILVFDITGNHAHFKTFDSNSSSLTYYFPPRTTLAGMVSSILAGDYLDFIKPNTYQEHFYLDKAKFGLKVLNKPRIVNMGFNYLMKNKPGHTQINKEVLFPEKDKITYRIYITHKDKELLDILERKIKEQRFGYGLALGQKQYIAYATFIERLVYKDFEIIDDFEGELDTSIIPQNEVLNYFKNSSSRYMMPLVLNEKRECLKTGLILYDDNGLNGKFKKILKIGDKKISFYSKI
ncbi:MAG: CRISPR-associated protein Cas5 [Candidatus Woesearchaeota archaeon]